MLAGPGLRDRRYAWREGKWMWRDLQKNNAAGGRRPGRNGIVSIVMALGIFMSITACGRQRLMDIETASADTENGAELIVSAEQDSVEPLPTDIGMNEKEPVDIRDEVSDIGLIKIIEENVILSDATEIQACEWVDEEKSCLRIRVQYKEPPSDNYQHKEDYFFFLEGEDIQALHVEYPTKDWHNMEEDRYVWDACDFVAYLEDVTFDGRDDLVIFLGHAGSRGDLIHGVYVYEDGFYCYKPGFEDIPNYEADTKEQVIRGWSDSAISSTTYVYKYQNGDFELISYEDYDTDIPGFNSYDIAP